MLVLLAFLVCASPGQDATTDPKGVPISLERIKRELQRTPALRVSTPPPEPTFKVEVVQHPYFLEMPYTWNWGGGGVPVAAPAASPSGSPPLFTIDLLPLLKAAKRAYDRHAATDR